MRLERIGVMLDLPRRDRDTIVLAVGGMTCGSCAAAVQRVLARVPGVVKADVDHASRRAVITGTAPVENLIRAVEVAGYSAEAAQNSAARASSKSGCGCCS
jgi:Cu+-exporting ATPase